jgi:hypothetical protein
MLCRPVPRWPLLAGLATLSALSAAAGCVGKTSSGGDPPDAPGGGPGKDAAPGIDALTDALAPFTCRDKITTGLDGGRHYPGANCQDGCHNHNFFMSGTLLTSATADPNSPSSQVVGASITFIDANGMTGDMHTAVNGNFWWSLPVAFPVTVIASSCPDVQKMTAVVTEAGSGCNQAGGCHGGSAGRIHLP